MNASIAPGATIDPAEAERFGRMAADWWDPRGSSAMLHRLNPVRLGYIRRQIDLGLGAEPDDRRPLAGRRALDVGCGAGLLAEPLARMGAAVTGVDAAAETIAVARTHALGQGLAIDYVHGEVADLTGGPPFDLICCLEVIEHVAEPGTFLRVLARLLAPGGLLILSTPNRTALSRLTVVGLGETLGGIPPGTHDWNRFVTPDELGAMLGDAGLVAVDTSGIVPSPTRGFALGRSTAMNYICTIRRAEDA